MFTFDPKDAGAGRSSKRHMTRTEALHAILDFAGPLGPFQEPDEQEQREEAWAASADADAVGQILDLIIHPPSERELRRVAPEAFEFEVSRVLTMIGARAPSSFLAVVGPLLNDMHARRTIIEVIGSLELEEGLSWLRPLVEDRGLAEEEAIRLACALGEIGGAAATALLDQLEAATPAERTPVLDEISIAREAVRRSQQK
jgi:hypothetical protein